MDKYEYARARDQEMARHRQVMCDLKNRFHRDRARAVILGFMARDANFSRVAAATGVSPPIVKTILFKHGHISWVTGRGRYYVNLGAVAHLDLSAAELTAAGAVRVREGVWMSA